MVTVDHAHNKRVRTSPNPTEKSYVDDMLTCSIFLRTHLGDPDRDGNPLIYALKGMRGYTITRGEIQKLYMPFSFGLTEAIGVLLPETIIPVPSTSRLNKIVTKRIVRETTPHVDVCDCFEKLTNGTVLQFADANKPNVPKQHRRAFTTALSELSRKPSTDLFQIKNVANRLRGYFKPIGFGPGAFAALVNNRRVVLVEDVLSSGTTLAVAKRLIYSRYQPASVSVITLFTKA